MAVNFVTYNTAEERLAAFRRSVSLRKEWEAKMAPAMKEYREKNIEREAFLTTAHRNASLMFSEKI
ncbi:MAG: hypothetical protein J6P01_03210 [Prevotella sp.]|nr:hypothetical protein [Prevotella sp.]